METLTKGNVAEVAVMQGFVRLDVPVLVPFGGGHPYDLAAEVAPSVFLRVQCKHSRINRGCIVFNSCSTDHGRGRLSYLGLADIFGVYSATTDSVYLVPVAETPAFQGRLRIEATRNNQQSGVRYAADFHLDKWDADSLARIVAAPHLSVAEVAA